jgi:drug/metabolite transporter (DMT)-like permease
MNSRQRVIGFIEIIAASICFGFLGVFGKLAFSNGISVGELLTYRFLLAAFLLWATLILFKPSWAEISGRQFLISGALGVFGYALFATLYFKAVEGLSVALAALLLYTYPLWVQVITFVMGEKPTPWQLLCTAIASVGLVFIVGSNHRHFLYRFYLRPWFGHGLCYLHCRFRKISKSNSTPDIESLRDELQCGGPFAFPQSADSTPDQF